MLQTDKKKKKGFSDFDADLKFGKEHEEKAKAMLFDQRSTFEFKTERDYWYKTGNMAVEVECYGKPSGINVTKAKYWCVNFVYNGELFERRIFNTPIIKKLVKKIPKNKYVISESGIKSINDMIDLWSYGIKGFLIGETLLKNQSILKDFLNVKTN